MIAGIDIGSRSIELVVMDNDTVVRQEHLPTTFDPVRQCKSILSGLEPDRIVATGYGRKLVEGMDLGTTVETITEIKAHALGVFRTFPEARTVLDIGGQDTKAISLLPGGKVGKFEMNDRCAAGTGKFLEYTATIFQIPVEEFGSYALKGDDPPVINSMCTVFAETEATSLMAQGVAPENIALGLHKSIVRRTVNMLGRVKLAFPLVFVGGVAHNPCMAHLLADSLECVPGKDIIIPETPDMNGALGAAHWGGLPR